jgi:hypothetical protein
MFKAKPHQLTRSGDGQFGTQWNYECKDHPIEEAMKDGYFDNTVGNLLPGDSIRVVEMKDNIVTAFCDFIVVSKSPAAVYCRPSMKDIVRFAKPAVREDDKRRAVYTAPPAPKYIQGTGEVKWSAGQKKFIITVDGKEVAAVRDKDEAYSIARGDLAMPV